MLPQLLQVLNFRKKLTLFLHFQKGQDQQWKKVFSFFLVHQPVLKLISPLNLGNDPWEAQDFQ